MSLHAVNTTDFDQGSLDESGSKLSPGYIALITILSTFVFFLTVMLMVCVGEHCQYSRGRKKQAQGTIRKSKRHTAHTDTDLQTNSKCNSISELTSAIVQANPSHTTNIERQHSYTRTFENAQKSSSLTTQNTSALTAPLMKTNRDNTLTTNSEIEILTDDDEKYVDSFESVTITIDTEGDHVCDPGDMGSSLPLLEQLSDDTLDVDGGDGEIFCDSSDFREFRLEADV